MKKKRLLDYLLVFAGCILASCEMSFRPVEMTGDNGEILFGIDSGPGTRAELITSLSSFRASAYTANGLVWDNVSFSQPNYYQPYFKGGKYWPNETTYQNAPYTFIAANANMETVSDKHYVKVSYDSYDIVVAGTDNPTYGQQNGLTFEHVQAYLNNVTVSAEEGYTISNITVSLTNLKRAKPYSTSTNYTQFCIEEGTYFGADGTLNVRDDFVEDAWTNYTTSTQTIATSLGSSTKDYFVLPGEQTLHVYWRAQKTGYTETFSRDVTLQFNHGEKINLNIILGGKAVDVILTKEVIPWEIEDEVSENTDEVLVMEFITGGTLQFKKNSTGIDSVDVGPIQYSKNGGAWTSYTATGPSSTSGISVSAGDILCLRSNNSYLGTATSTTSMKYAYFATSAEFYLYGDISALVNGNRESLPNGCFAHLFKNCTKIHAHPTKKLRLPAKQVGKYAYAFMFENNTTLERMPEIAATTMSDYSCYVMFYNCTALTEVSELPATTLGQYCYESMFRNCSSLRTVPERMLPAQTLSVGCYYEMFLACRSLAVSKGFLPAKNLASMCYYGMFSNKSIPVAPDLPATTLAYDCYKSMFEGNVNLVEAPEILPATTLGQGEEYMYMFKGCTSLTRAPYLPALDVTNYAYYQMFYGCTSLNYVKAMFTSRTNQYATYQWLTNVAATGTFVKNADTPLTDSELGVPSGWTVLTEAPTDKSPATFGGLMISPAPARSATPSNGSIEFWIVEQDGKARLKETLYNANEKLYTDFVSLGKYFDSRGDNFTEVSGDIDNLGRKVNYGGYDDWRVPTDTEWSMLATNSTSVRQGATVNGRTGSHYIAVSLFVSLSEYSYTCYNGVLFFPDGKTINLSGKNLYSYIDNGSSTYIILEPDELQSFIDQGCAFVLGMDYKAGKTSPVQYMMGDYDVRTWFHSTKSNASNASYSNPFCKYRIDTSGQSKTYYYPVYLVRSVN